jgi:hypothetical protein
VTVLVLLLVLLLHAVPQQAQAKVSDQLPSALPVFSLASPPLLPLLLHRRAGVTHCDTCDAR